MLKEEPYVSMEKDQRLMMFVDLLSKQPTGSSNEKAALFQKIDDLMPMVSVNNNGLPN